MMNYEVEMTKWPYKGTDEQKITLGLNIFWLRYPKKVRMALWEYDVWGCLWNKDAQITYVQTWAEATDNMHSYPFTSLDELADYLIKEEGYSYTDLVTLGYDAVNQIDPNDDIWVWEYDYSLRSYARWTDFMDDFADFGNWDNFVHWATNFYENGSKAALKKVLQFKDTGIHLDYMEMLWGYFGPYLDQLTGDKRDWFIRRIKDVYQIGDEDAESILLGKE